MCRNCVRYPADGNIPMHVRSFCDVSAQSNLKTCHKIATLCGREWTRLLHVLVVQCQQECSQLAAGMLLPLYNVTLPPHFPPKEKICHFSWGDQDPI